MYELDTYCSFVCTLTHTHTTVTEFYYLYVNFIYSNLTRNSQFGYSSSIILYSV